MPNLELPPIDMDVTVHESAEQRLAEEALLILNSSAATECSQIGDVSFEVPVTGPYEVASLEPERTYAFRFIGSAVLAAKNVTVGFAAGSSYSPDNVSESEEYKVIEMQVGVAEDTEYGRQEDNFDWRSFVVMAIDTSNPTENVSIVNGINGKTLDGEDIMRLTDIMDILRDEYTSAVADDILNNNEAPTEYEVVDLTERRILFSPDGYHAEITTPPYELSDDPYRNAALN